MTQEQAALHAIIGTAEFLRARAAVENGEVFSVRWLPESGRAAGRVLGSAVTAAVTATVTVDELGGMVDVQEACDCGSGPGCGHAAALVLLALEETPGYGVRAAGFAVPHQVTPGSTERKRTAAWEKTLAALMGGADAAPAAGAAQAAEMGLQFDVVADTRGRKARPWRVALRPVVPGRTGWVRSGISWSSIGYARYGSGPLTERCRRLLQEIAALSSPDGHFSPYGYGQQVLYLDGFPSRRIWDLLAEAQEIGLPLVQTGRAGAPVRVNPAPVRASMHADRHDGALVLTPTLQSDDEQLAPEFSLLVGEPAHGVIWWGTRGQPDPQPKDRVLRVAPLAAPLTKPLERMLAAPPIRIPPRDERRFLQDFYPGLVRQIDVHSPGGEVELPDLGPATLVLLVVDTPQPALSVAWRWEQPVGDTTRVESLHEQPPASQAQQRADLLQSVTALVAGPVPQMVAQDAGEFTLAMSATVTGDAMIRLLRDVAPRLGELDGVQIRADVTADFREIEQAPQFSFVDAGASAEGDWFDLSVQVSVDGRDLPFNELFVALAQDREFLMLPGGAYFSLDRPEFQQLRELIAEARALDDPPPGILRVGRFQAGLWAELDEIGEVTGAARAWQESVRALSEYAGGDEERPVPKGLDAQLRPYQLDGFTWLTTLYERGLGGILADDMGLGKTLQALALICHVREQRGAGAPFLVVAPASVVHNWVVEAARFAPDLVVRAITQTQARRVADLATCVADADVIITSYTLFRLEHDAYQELDWRGLILDEAQFIKNAQAKAHQCARLFPAPFKLAITGTPMENNLAELWALCAVTAPGLFPRLDRFTEYYRNPIEKNRDAERLAQLRRRVRPLMLRRRKADVATDLPDKQEQVIELELTPKHRKIYQTYLQRERQKVLGLLGDFGQHRFEIFRSLTLLRQASLDVALVDPKHQGVPSTKLEVLSERIADLVAEGHRTLVFSQFTRFLDAARVRLERDGVPCVYLDGKTRDRAAVLAAFKDGTAPVFLISLKAGGFGLNLTEADYCILLDPWWNPATEAQAVDRVHRIGQSRHVMVYRLVAKDTIEEKVMALKARKAELFSSVLDGGDFASALLSASDIQALLE
jgi:superfamily II DNA or RNA helicase